jgi:carboxypeptidase C (cathepsin A)
MFPARTARMKGNVVTKILLSTSALVLLATAAFAAEKPANNAITDAAKPSASTNAAPDRGILFQPEEVASEGVVNAGGQRVDYRAIAGTIIVHPKGWDDAAWREQSQSDLGDKKGAMAEASMFYAAYFKKGVPAANRPITFLYNGGPGSSTVWLHMGAFGPRRIVTADDSHDAAAPYTLVDNAYSLLDVSDLVFIDAPGTGFSRIAGKDKEKGFYGVDADAHAFEEFIKAFLSRYGRWNSPKYLFGESYGTPRSAVVVNALETGDSIDFNGVILLSQILNFDLDSDGPDTNPGLDQGYVVSLPTMAATAWYHNRLPGQRPADLVAFLHQVEQFALTDYALALNQGSELDPARRQAVAQKMSDYIGLPVDYLMKADLRVTGPMFEKKLQEASGLTTGRLDTRFSGPDLDPLSRQAEYDPQSASISSAYVSAFNDYARTTLHFGGDRTFKPEIDVFKDWSFAHVPAGGGEPSQGAPNVMPDLAMAMKYNPKLKIMLNGGYFDLATPYFEGIYEMHHLPIPASLQANIEYHYYQSGHMVYANDASARQLHDNVAAFIRRTDNLH